jgi:hypothetical protein
MLASKNRTSRIVHAAVAAMAAVTLLAGCAGSKLGAQTVKVQYYPDCYQPISDLRRDADEMNANVAKGAVGGALLGAIGGLIAGGGDWRYAVAGAAIGAVAGATVSYLVTDDIQTKNQAERFATYKETMDVDYKNLEAAVAAARIAQQCYKREYTKVEKAYSPAGSTMPKEEMIARVTEIRDGSNDAITILTNYSDTAAANIETYDQVVQVERTRKADRPAASRVRTVTTANNKMKSKNNEAQTLIADLNITKTASQTLLDNVVSGIGEAWISLQAQSGPVSAPSAGR